MYKLFMIAKNNIKKQKGDMITFLILTLLSSFLIFICVSALSGMGSVMDRRFNEINGAHAMVYVENDTDMKGCVERAFKDNDHVIDCETTPLIEIYAEYKNARESEWKEYEFIAESYDEEKTQMKVLDIDSSDYSENDIFIPLYLKSSFSIGDTLELKLNDNKYKFNVAGYAKDPYFSSSINITVYSVYMSPKMIKKLVKENPDKAFDFVVVKGRVDESTLAPTESNVIKTMLSINGNEDYYSTTDLEREITKSYKDYISPISEKNPEKDYLSILAVNWEMMRGGSQFVPMIAMAVIMMFGVLILIIAIIIISFSIKNFIKRNMKNTGILEASGYTVKELRLTIVVQIVLVSFIGSLLGVVFAILTYSQFSDFLSILMGLTWNLPVDYAGAALTVIILSVLIFIVAWIISRAYKKTSILDELRGGINSHNFKRNHFTFEKTHLPIPFVLSLKSSFGEWGKSLLLTFIIMILTVSTLTGFGLMEDFGRDPSKLTAIMAFDTGVALIEGSDSIEDEINSLEGADSVLMSTGFEPLVSYKDKSQNVYTYAYKDMSKRPTAVMIEGRFAKRDNEIVITEGVSEDFGVGIGDVLSITVGDKSVEYIVTGIDQRMERMGRNICMTFDGAIKLGVSTSTVNYTLSGKDGVTFDDIKKEVEDKGIKVNSMIDIDKNMKSTLGTVSMVMNVLCLVIAAVTILVVIFVEALVIRAKIVREWRTFGISKALGMTSGQIVLEIMLSNVPGIIIGILLGIASAEAIGGRLCVLCFSIFAIKKVVFYIPPIWYVVTAIVILSVALLTAGLFGLKTRTLQPVNMITEE